MKVTLQHAILRYHANDKSLLYHISHNDLDGVAPLITSKHVFKDRKMNLRYVSNKKVDLEITRALAVLEPGDLLLITDVSPSEEVAKALQTAHEAGVLIVLLDHHRTALWLNEYNWAYVANEDAGKLHSATNLYYDLLVSAEILQNNTPDALSDFVEQVRLWDTWLWNAEKLQIPKNLNSLYYLTGYREFSEYMLRILGNQQFFLDKSAKKILTIEEARIQRYMKSKNDHARIVSVGTHTVAVTFADQYISETGNHIAESNPDVDYVALVDPSKGLLSLRSATGKADVSIVAKKNGGGGHEHAAGCPLSESLISQYVIPALSAFNNEVKLC